MGAAHNSAGNNKHEQNKVSNKCCVVFIISINVGLLVKRNRLAEKRAYFRKMRMMRQIYVFFTATVKWRNDFYKKQDTAP